MWRTAITRRRRTDSAAEAHRLDSRVVENATGIGEIANARMLAAKVLVLVPCAEKASEGEVLLSCHLLNAMFGDRTEHARFHLCRGPED